MSWSTVTPAAWVSATALNRFALEMAKDNGAVSVDLTSRPHREAANRLYKRLGFEMRDTNVYRYNLTNG